MSMLILQVRQLSRRNYQSQSKIFWFRKRGVIFWIHIMCFFSPARRSNYIILTLHKLLRKNHPPPRPTDQPQQGSWRAGIFLNLGLDPGPSCPMLSTGSGPMLRVGSLCTLFLACRVDCLAGPGHLSSELGQFSVPAHTTLY